jgi:hypothetical protein
VSESMSTRKMVLVVAVSCTVTAVVVCIIAGMIMRTMINTQQYSEATLSAAEAVPAKQFVAPKGKEPGRAVGAEQTGVKRTEIHAVIQHRFEEGDRLRHVSGNSEYDVEVTGVDKYMLNDGTIIVKYSLRLDHWIGSMYGSESLPAPFVDACYNKL